PAPTEADSAYLRALCIVVAVRRPSDPDRRPPPAPRPHEETTMLTRLHDALRLRTSPVVFFGSAGLIILFVLATLLLTEQMDALFADGSAWLITNLGWFYVLGVTVFLLFLLYLATSRFGQV